MKPEWCAAEIEKETALSRRSVNNALRALAEEGLLRGRATVYVLAAGTIG